MTRRTTRRLGEISIAPGSGIDRGHKCTCWPKPDDARPCTPQSCDPGCRACRIHGRPFYSHGDLLYLEHGSGPLAAELERLWRGKGTMKRGTAPHAARPDGVGRRALPRGAAGLVPRRPQARTVTDLYYPGLQDPRQGITAATPAADRSWASRLPPGRPALPGLERGVRTSVPARWDDGPGLDRSAAAGLRFVRRAASRPDDLLRDARAEVSTTAARFDMEGISEDAAEVRTKGARMRYKVGAEHMEQIPSLTHRPNGVFRSARTLPVGPTHAVDATTGAVACGITAHGLDVLEQDWEEAFFVEKCPGCFAAVVAQSEA